MQFTKQEEKFTNWLESIISAEKDIELWMNDLKGYHKRRVEIRQSKKKLLEWFREQISNH